MITKLLCLLFHIGCCQAPLPHHPVVPPATPTVVPEPATYLLMGLGLLFVAGFGRKFRKQA